MEIGTFAGICLMAYVPLLFVGLFVYAPLGRDVTSASTGARALSRLAQSGRRFEIANAIFHLGPLLLLPAMVALFLDLYPTRPVEASVGTLIGLIAFSVPIGLVFALSLGLVRLARSYANANDADRSALTAAAEANLGTQAGAEFVQTGIGGIWVLAISAAMLVSPHWPTWIGVLGLVAGAGFSAAGFSSLVDGDSGVGRVLRPIGGVGVVAFAVWLFGVGWLLVA